MPLMFRVGKGGGQINGSNQPGTPQWFTPPTPMNYVDVTWPYNVIDETGWFDFSAGVWRPESSGRALMNWQIWDAANVYTGGATSLVSKLIGLDLNGVTKEQDAAPIGNVGSFPNTSPQGGGVAIKVATGDVWRIANYCRNVAGQQVMIDPHNAHTYWSCLFFPD